MRTYELVFNVSHILGEKETILLEDPLCVKHWARHQKFKHKCCKVQLWQSTVIKVTWMVWGLLLSALGDAWTWTLDTETADLTKWPTGGDRLQRGDSRQRGGSCPRWVEWTDGTFHRSAQNGGPFETRRVFISVIFHWIFSDCGWLWVIETRESKTRNKEGPFYLAEETQLVSEEQAVEPTLEWAHIASSFLCRVLLHCRWITVCPTAKR